MHRYACLLQEFPPAKSSGKPRSISLLPRDGLSSRRIDANRLSGARCNTVVSIDPGGVVDKRYELYCLVDNYFYVLRLGFSTTRASAGFRAQPRSAA